MFTKIVGSAAALLVSTVAIADLKLENHQRGVFQRPDVQLNSGERLISGGREQIRVTDHVPARLGSKFGVRYSVSGKQSSNNRLTYLYLTPGVVEPDGTRHDKYEEIVELQQGVASHVAAFEFSEAWEVVSGLWELLIFEGDTLLLREAFNVSVQQEHPTPGITPVRFD